MWRLIGAIVWQAAWAASFVFAVFQFKLNFELPVAALVGAIFGGLVWLIVNFSSSKRYLDWLREGDLMHTPKLWGVWGEATDRAQRLLKTQNRDLQTSNHRLNDFLAAIQASPNGVVLLDQNEQIEWCNLTAANHFGLNPAKDISQHIGNLVRDPDFKAYIAAGDYASTVTINGKNSTSNRISRLSVHIHPYGLGKKLILSNDVTSIEAAEIMRRDFVANVSHEIRTPLTVLSGFVETLQTLDLDANERAKYLVLMSQQSLRMQSLVGDLLTLSKLEGSPAPLLDSWIDVDQLLSTCEQEAKALKADLYGEDIVHDEKNSQSLVFEVQSGIELAGSQVELLSAMCNLVNNAVRYTPLDGKIRVSFQALDRGGAIFSVNDSGLGISPEHLPRLTERFYRVDTSRSRESGGTGLGLAIVKHVVQRHGGELKISSTLGKGSTFCFTLPEYRVRFKNLELSAINGTIEAVT
jgi:two-component system, OmpR family, phosphate regulon sensor histidine kinase PhoR